MIVCDNCKCGDKFPDAKARRVRPVVVTLSYDGEEPGEGTTAVRIEFSADRECADQFAAVIENIIKQNLQAPPAFMRQPAAQPTPAANPEPSPNGEAHSFPRHAQEPPYPN